MDLLKCPTPALLLLALALAACGGDRDATSAGSAPVTPAPTQSEVGTPAATPSEVTPGRTAFEQCRGEPSDPAACTEDLPGPVTRVPTSVMLRPDLDRAEDRSGIERWRAAYCPPSPRAPRTATAMRTRVWQGPAATPETGPLKYAQQVAAFPSVEAAVAAARQLVSAADSCNVDGRPAGPRVTELPLGTQARLVVFAEGGDYSIRGFFRRANAIASVQGSGDSEDDVREALNTSFARLCIYERPDGC